MPMNENPVPRVGYEQVVGIVGHMDEEYITRIVDSGATADEVLEAFTWFNAEEAIGPDPRHRMNVNVARVYEILVAAEGDDEERRD